MTKLPPRLSIVGTEPPADEGDHLTDQGRSVQGLADKGMAGQRKIGPPEDSPGMPLPAPGGIPATADLAEQIRRGDHATIGPVGADWSKLETAYGPDAIAKLAAASVTKVWPFDPDGLPDGHAVVLAPTARAMTQSLLDASLLDAASVSGLSGPDPLRHGRSVAVRRFGGHLVSAVLFLALLAAIAGAAVGLADLADHLRIAPPGAGRSAGHGI